MSNHSDGISDFLDESPRPKKPGRRFPFVAVFTAVGIIGLLIALLLPAIRTAGPAVVRIQCVNNLKQIALALYNYESAYKALPPAYTVDGAGRPLHSWRTLILPYLEQKSLYDAIDLSKPWNDPANANAYAKTISAYHCPGLDRPDDETTYLAVVGANSCFLPDQSRRLSEITDDTGKTLMVIEADREHAVHWMAPIDADASLVLGISPESKLNHPGGMNAAFVDDSVRFLKATTSATLRRALISIEGNDDKDVSPNEF